MHQVPLRSRVRSRLFVLVALGALLVAGGVTLLLVNTIDLRNSTRATDRANLYLQRVTGVERLVVDAETGLRGDVITGRSLFLQPLYHAQARLPGALAALREAAAQDHAYQGQTAALVTAARSYMSLYVQQVLGLTMHDLPAARSFPVTLEGKRLVDGIRAQAADLEGLVAASQARRLQAARDTASRSIVESILVLGLLTLLTLALGGYLGRLVVQRELARDRSQETTRVLQKSILPAEVPEIPGCELATRFIPGGGVVSGDFYDVLEDETGGWALMIGDVCGKGPAAASATAMARWTLRSSLRLGAAPADALRLLNDVVLDQDRDGRFITVACLRVTFESEAARVAIACAGHPAPILVPRDGAPVTVDAGGDLLGIMPAIRLRTAEVRLAPGDSLVAYTDGVTDQGPESRRAPEEALGERGPDAAAEELVAILQDVAQEPAGRHPDDIALIALRYLGRETPPPDPETVKESPLEGARPI
jgi:serine phosphatase RsbU (regulator of sigma subunit)